MVELGYGGRRKRSCYVVVFGRDGKGFRSLCFGVALHTIIRGRIISGKKRLRKRRS